jgi:magnesium transporter
MFKYMYYNSGKKTCEKGTKLDYKIPAGSDFVWILMEKPDEHEISKVSKDFKISRRHFETFRKEKRSARYSINPLVFVFMDYYMEGEKIESSHILFVLKENALIIALPTITPFHNELFDRLVTLMETSKTKNIATLMYQFLLDDVNENYDVLDKVDTLITDIEKRVVMNANKMTIADVVKIKRRIHLMARRFWGSAKIIFTIKKGLTPLKPDVESMRMLDDVYDTYMHQVDILSSYKDMLTDILTIHTTQASNDMNLIIKRLTSFTVILMVPTLIASIYGMNFAEIPELHSEYGYPTTLIAMIVSIALLYAFFHRKKWI